MNWHQQREGRLDRVPEGDGLEFAGRRASARGLGGGLAGGRAARGRACRHRRRVEMATARALAAAGNLDWNPAKMAKLGQRAENKWVGVNCGIMDQLISAAGRANHALLIDCRSLQTQPVPFPPGTAVVVLDTSTRRGLVDSAYNERRSQCEAAAKFFGVSVLRDVTMRSSSRKSVGQVFLSSSRLVGQTFLSADLVAAHPADRNVCPTWTASPGGGRCT